MKKDIVNENKLLEQAIRFAVERHSGATRKGKDTPYILHPLEAMQILSAIGADTNLMIAGVLHDTVEDTNTTLEEIEAVFGEDVAELVASNSEDKTKSWDERKAHTIEYLKTAPYRNKLLIFADKLANQRSLYRDYKKLGEDLWKRFNAPAEKQAWYYSEVQDAFYDFQNIPEIYDFYWEMVNTYKDLFVRYYYDSAEEKIYQRARYGYVSCHKLYLPGWERVEEDINWDSLALIERYEAEKAEDRYDDEFWNAVRHDCSDKSFTFKTVDGDAVEVDLSDGFFSMNVTPTGDEFGYSLKLDENDTVKLFMHFRRKYGLDNSTQEMIELEFICTDLNEHFKALGEELAKIE